MRIRIILGVLAFIVVAGGAMFLRLQWASRPPHLPKNMPRNSVWIDVRSWPVRFSPIAYFEPRGYWTGCWLDTQRNINRCRFADYKGKVSYEADYTTCDGKAPIRDDGLQLANRRQAFLFVTLADGTTLTPQSECELDKRIHDLDWCPGCQEPFPKLKQQSSQPDSR